MRSLPLKHSITNDDVGAIIQYLLKAFAQVKSNMFTVIHEKVTIF